jgi:PAS domain S-box-containing protein
MERQIIIIDKNSERAEKLRAALIRAGFNAVAETLPEQGISAAVQMKPDIILLDVMAPGAEGFDICRRLKSEKSVQDIPILFIMDSADAVDTAAGLAAGAADYISAPFDMAEVTARIRTHLELRRLNHQLNTAQPFEKIFDAVPDLIMILDTEHRVIKMNKPMQKALGLNPESVVGKTCYQLVHHLNSPPWFCPHARLIHDGNPHKTEVYDEKMGGHFVVSDVPLYDDRGGLIGGLHVAWDITEQRLFQKDLHYRAGFEHLIAEISSKLIRFSHDRVDDIIHDALAMIGKYARVDRCYIFLFSEDGLSMDNTHEWCADGIVSQIQHLKGLKMEDFKWIIHQISDLKTVHIPRVADLPDEAGTEKAEFQAEGIQSLILVPMSYREKAMGFIGFDSVRAQKQWVREDISLLKTTADLFANALLHKQSAENLRKARDAAESASQTKTEFLANMSHEIRTPMNAILGFSEILEEKITDTHLKEYLSIIQSSGKALMNLLNDILDLSKIEAGKMEISLKPIQPARIFSDIVRIFSQKTAEKGLKLILIYDPHLPSTLMLDETRLRQILFNLMGNAVKFTETGEIHLSVYSGRTNRERETIDLVFSVEDTGIGIPSEQQEVIFGAFEQAKNLDASRYGGTGLGLAITRRLVKMMNGDISVSAVPGQGSVFTVILKDVVISPEDSAPPKEIPDTCKVLRFEPAVLLIADDAADNRFFLKKCLEAFGFTLLEAANGQKLIETVRRHRPSLVLTDIKMPILDGIEAVKILKSDENTREIPVIAVTGAAAWEADKDITLWCDGFLRKPVFKSELILKLRQFLKHSIENVPAEEACPPQSSQAQVPDIMPENSEQMTQVIRTLKEVFMPAWKEINGFLIMEDIARFAGDLKQLSQEYNLAVLTQYSKDLLNEVQHFRIDIIEQMLHKFPELVDQIQKMGQKQST